MNRPHIYPVIHLGSFDIEHTLEQVKLAQACGADGVFLISHTGQDRQVVHRANVVKTHFAPNFKVGINLLSTGNQEAFVWAVDCQADMLWVDAPGVTSNGISDHGRQLKQTTGLKPSIEVFASVAFKYQPIDLDPPRAAQLALEMGFTPTTSGTGTGSAPTVEKIQSMSAATGGKLAVASGMTPDNVALYAPYLKDILVSTGISKNEHELDAARLRQFVNNARVARND